MNQPKWQQQQRNEKKKKKIIANDYGNRQTYERMRVSWISIFYNDVTEKPNCHCVLKCCFKLLFTADYTRVCVTCMPLFYFMRAYIYVIQYYLKSGVRIAITFWIVEFLLHTLCCLALALARFVCLLNFFFFFIHSRAILGVFYMFFIMFRMCV